MRKPIRFLWSHQGVLHRRVVRAGNGFLALVPTGIKYRTGWLLRRGKLPYSLAAGLNIVQIGAPFDTLGAGRSRAAYLGMGAGSRGSLLVVEPLPSSCSTFEAFASFLDCDTTVVSSAVWSEPGEVELFVDEQHPATNFSSSTVNYSDDRQSDFRSIVVPSNTLDNIVIEAGFAQPDLVSITTNWAEEEILAGMSGLIEMGVRYICLALGEGDEDYRQLMSDLGYEPMGFDDRGVTYRRM